MPKRPKTSFDLKMDKSKALLKELKTLTPRKKSKEEPSPRYHEVRKELESLLDEMGREVFPNSSVFKDK